MSFDSSPRSLHAAAANIHADTVNATVDDTSNDNNSNGDGNVNQVGHNLFVTPLIETRTISDSETEAPSEGMEDEASNEMTQDQYNFEDNGNSMVGFHDSSTSNETDDEFSQLNHELRNEMYDFFNYVQQVEEELGLTFSRNTINDAYENRDGDFDLYGYTVGGHNDDAAAADDDDENNDDDDVYSDLDEDFDPCTCPNCLMDRITMDEEPVDSNRDDHLCDEFFERPLNPDASPCAICMDPETASRRFVHLPCCSPVGTDMDPSSTRFCQKCLTRCLVTTGCAVPSKCPKSLMRAQLMGECPRCKQLLVLNDLTPDECEVETSINNTSTLTPLYKRTRVAMPTTDALFWYVARNGKTVGVKYRAYLVTLAVCPNPHFIPEELLFQNIMTPERLRILCQWGLIRKQTTTQEWLQRYKAGVALEKVARVSLEHLKRAIWVLWQGMEWIAGSYLESARYSASNWRVSKLLLYMKQSIQEQSKHEGSVVYCMDPLVHSELRSLVFRHLHCFDKDEWVDDYEDFDCDEHEREEDDAVKILAPLMREATKKEQDDIDDFCWRNCHQQCLLKAWDASCSAHRAFRRLSLFRGLWLTNLALSLALLSLTYVGLPPLVDWPAPKPNSWIARWRWHLLTGLNLFLVKVAFGVVVKLLGICADLLLEAVVCIGAGKVIEAWTPQKGKREKNEWITASQTFSCVFGFFYFVWKAYLAWKASALEGNAISGLEL